MSDMEEKIESESSEDIFSQRLAKLSTLRESGVEPFGGRFDGAGKVSEARAGYREDGGDGQTVRLAGRLMSQIGRAHV